MAWVQQTFSGSGIIASLGTERVVICPEGMIGPPGAWVVDEVLTIEPQTQEQAHSLALTFRRVARRLEEIGKELP